MNTPRSYEATEVAVPGGKVWCRRSGRPGKTPLLVLHGGPGFPHDYLTPLDALSNDRPVVFYDQLGCGRSDRPSDPSLWTLDRSLAELDAVRKTLHLDQVVILGHSWGALLAVEHALRLPCGLQALILASPVLSMPRFQDDTRKLVEALPSRVQKIIRQHEAAGTTDSEEYIEASKFFARRHICRLDPWPAELTRTLEEVGWEVYETMQGPSEFCITGWLREYDVTDQLPSIGFPILLTCGRFDEATPEATSWYESLLSQSRLVVFEESAHMPHLEESARYLETIRKFLNHNEMLRGEASDQMPRSS